jgi:capsular polysaccharide biosynthesis protein
LELADILRSLRRRWRIAVAIVLLTGVVVVGALATQKDTKPAPRFRAESHILVPTRDDKGTFPEGTPPELFFGQSQLAGSGAVRNAALAAVPAAQRAGVGFGYEQNETGDIITLSATAGSAETARAVASAWANSYIKARGAAVARGSAQSQAGARRALQVLKSRLRSIEVSLSLIDPNLLNINAGTGTDPNPNSNGSTVAPTVPSNLPVDSALLVYERAEVRARIEEVGRQYAEGATTALAPGNFATIVEVPPIANITPPASPSKTPTLLIVVVGLLLALAVPILVDRLDHTIRDTKTATAALAAPLLSSIPAAPRGRREEVAKPGTHREAAYRALAATSLATDRLPRSIVVTSPLGDAQDSVAANFATALAGLGVRVALIGTLPRQGWFTHDAVLEPRNNNGTSEATTFPQLLELAYSGRLNGDAPSLLQRTTVENLYVLPPGDTTIDIANDGLPPLLEALARAHIDVTVIAAPAILNDPNTTIYAWTTRSVLWVVERGEITVEQARDAASRLSLAGAVPFGVAMVDEDS